jgi:hypothetical protein
VLSNNAAPEGHAIAADACGDGHATGISWGAVDDNPNPLGFGFGAGRPLVVRFDPAGDRL